MKEAGRCNGRSVSERKDIWLFVIDVVKNHTTSICYPIGEMEAQDFLPRVILKTHRESEFRGRTEA